MAEARDENCEVVTYGDSTALADFFPAVIEAPGLPGLICTSRNHRD